MYFHLHGYIHMTTEPFTVETTRLRDGCYIIVLEYWVIQKKSKSVENYICLYICVFVCAYRYIQNVEEILTVQCEIQQATPQNFSVIQVVLKRPVQHSKLSIGLYTFNCAVKLHPFSRLKFSIPSLAVIILMSIEKVVQIGLMLP